jgi:hypothetical protein
MILRARGLQVWGTLAVMLLLGLGTHLVLAKDTPEPAGQTDVSSPHPDFKEFSIIGERNVFDATRKAGEKPASETASAPAVQQDVIVLTGTVIEEDGAWALFDGAPDVPAEGVETGGSVAGFHVDEVRIDGVTLSNDQGAVQVSVGAGLAKNESGVWIPVDNPAPAAAPDEAQKAGEGKKDPNDPAEKLRERRRKELGQ